MSKLKKYNLKAAEVGEADFADEICNTIHRPFSIKNVVVAYQAGLRQGTHKTKGRSEVSGSTRKLYKQKGTGNARVGDDKSPVRRGGGIVFGPVVRDYSLKVNKKEKTLALKSVLAQLIRENKVTVLENFNFDSSKTKDYQSILSNWDAKSFLIVDTHPDKNLLLGTRNLKSVKVVQSLYLNVFDLMKYNKVLITESALKDIEARILNQ